VEFLGSRTTTTNKALKECWKLPQCDRGQIAATTAATTCLPEDFFVFCTPVLQMRGTGIRGLVRGTATLPNVNRS